MAKNVVVCCDGTANEFVKAHTNVLKLFRMLDNAPGRQVAYYHPGLGTMEAIGALTSLARQTTKLLGLAVGYGLEREICEAYAFIMQNYEPDDALYLFGFSRGAYTVRAVASLLHMCGLLSAGNEPLVPYAVRLMSAANNRKDGEIFEMAADFRETFRGAPCKPHFVGVWDTVSSVGWIANPLSLPYTANNPDIAIGRHAVSLDERRAFFRSNLWRPDPPETATGPKNLQQVWFPGDHCDVGGGHPEADSGLSKFALEWMAREAALAGLAVDRTKIDELMGRAGSRFAKADPNATMHDSLTIWWRPAEYIPKRHWNWQTRQSEWRMNLGRRRTPPPKPLVHKVAFERAGYTPPPGAEKVETPPW